MKGIVRSRGDKIDLPDQDLAEDDYPDWDGMLDMDG
jgi:hypothetical protein